MSVSYLIPNNWIVAPLHLSCEIHDNLRKPINSDERIKRINGKNKNELYPYYGATGQVGYIDNYLTDGEYVLLGEDAAPFFDKTKNVAYLIKGKTWVNNHAHILKSLTLNNYLLHYLNYFDYRGYVTGTTRLKLTQASLKNIPIPLPPLAEQHRIVAKIEELFTSLDKSVETLKIAKQQLKVYRRAVLKYAFEGRLTHPDLKEGELPEGWEKTDVGSLCNVVRGGSPRPAGDPRFYNGSIPFLKVRDLTKDEKMFVLEAEFTIKEAGLTKTRLVKAGTLLLSNSGATLGVPKITAIDATMNDGVAAFLNLKCDSRYFYYFWKSKTAELRAINQGAAQPNLNTELIKEVKIVLPKDKEAQVKIVQEIESRLSVCDKLEESIEQSLQQAEALRQSILKKAFEGKLVPQEPNDEPASVLLERIAAARQNAGPVKRTKKETFVRRKRRV